MCCLIQKIAELCGEGRAAKKYAATPPQQCINQNIVSTRKVGISSKNFNQKKKRFPLDGNLMDGKPLKNSSADVQVFFHSCGARD